MGSPLVSVIVTCFNGAPWVEHAVRSVQCQTCSDYEITIVDDGSDEETTQLLRSLKDREDRLTVIFNENNRGIPATKNVGLEHARGEYIAFLEQDDRWKPSKLARQLDVLHENPNAGMVFTNAEYVLGDGRIRLFPRPRSITEGPRETVLRRFFMWNPVPSMSSVMLRSSCVDKVGLFDERFNGGDDYDYWLRVAAEFPIVYLDEPLVEYAVHQQNYSSVAAEQMHRDRLEVIRLALNRHPFLKPLQRKRHGSMYRSTAALLLENGRRRDAWKFAVQALRLDPCSLRSHLVLILIMTGEIGLSVLRKTRDASRLSTGTG
jgi:glycosyltransferase involved in cell wall biosynthesis